jgi:glycosyltransferase involved in cell wall biosynthesis
MSPLVSIVIINFNYARFLAKAIDSALAQGHRTVEVVVVDDGSTDRSRELIAGYGERVLPVLKENGGHASVFNAGFRASRGEFVIFVDSDDFIHRDAASRVCEAATDRCAKVQYRLSIVDEAGTPTGVDPPWSVPMPNGNVVPELLATGRYVTPVTAGNAYPRTVLEQIMPIPEEPFRMGGDGYLNAVCPFYGDIVSIDEELGYYRRHGAHQGFSPGAKEGPGPIRRRLEHDFLRERYIRATAEAQGLRVTGDLLLRDPAHVLNRLSLKRLDPSGELSTQYGRATLVRACLSAIRRSPSMSGADKLFNLIIVVVLGTFPGPLARRVAAWALASRPRARWLRLVANAARRLLRAPGAGRRKHEAG